MEVIRQVYEDSPDVITITVPEELRHQRVEVIVQPLINPTDSAELPELRERTVGELAAEFGIAPEDIRDPRIMKFAGSLPDFPPRGPQGDYETRLELEWE